MSTYTKRSSARRSDDTMDDDTEDKDDTKRKSRNLSEKKRRDQFNLLVNELSSMVSTGARKMDKSTVLRSTISFLKNHNEIAIRSRAHEIQEDWKPAFLSNEEFTHLILEALDGFIVVFSAAGHVHYVSESVTALLGHLPSELLNTSVYELVWDDEQAALYQALVGNGGTSPDGQLSFQAHLRRGGGGAHQPDGNDTRNDCYELVNFVGYLRTDVDMLENSPSAGTDSNRFSGYSGEADTRLFVGTGRLQTPQLIREMSLVDAADMAAAAVISGSCSGALNAARSSPGEFTSRHSLEWKFLFLDHRAPPIIGYLPFEVLGTSGYDYYHVDDLDQVVSCHEALMQKGEGTSCYYRFLTKGQQWIWLQTRFYITYHQWNSKPEFIVCTHRVVSYVDVMKQSRKKSDDSTMDESNITLLDSFPVPTFTPGSGTSSPWGHASSSHRGSASSQKGTGRHNNNRRPHSGAPSDCTSTSADSPASRQSQSSQQQLTGGIPINSGRSSQLSSHNQNPPPQQVQQVPCSSVQTLASSNHPVMFTEPHQLQNQNPSQQTQYVTTIPVQQTVIAGFATPTPITVLSPLLPTVSDGNTLVLTSASSSDPISSSPTATHLQAQLQRKHAELQAIIDQQQAELRRVSEQLLMARLGLLATSTTAANSHQPQQTQQQQQQQQQQQKNFKETGLNTTLPSTPTPTINGDKSVQNGGDPLKKSEIISTSSTCTPSNGDNSRGGTPILKREMSQGGASSTDRSEDGNDDSLDMKPTLEPQMTIKEDIYDNDDSYYDNGDELMDTDYLEQEQEQEQEQDEDDLNQPGTSTGGALSIFQNADKSPDYAIANVSCQYNDGSPGGGIPSARRIRRSEAELRRAAECITRGQTFQTVSDQFNIPISTIRFYMARKGILPRRKRGRACSAPGGQMSSPYSGGVLGVGHGTPLSGNTGFHNAPGNTSPSGPPYHIVHYKLPVLGAKLK